MHIQDQLRIAGAGVAARLFSYYEEGPPGLFGTPPVSESGWLWWQTPVALEALLQHESVSSDHSRHHLIMESFQINTSKDHRIFSPAWGGIENDEKNDDMLWWTLAALQMNQTDVIDSAIRSHDHVRRFWAGQNHASCTGGVRWSADPSHSGWSYLNSVTNGQFFLTSALLYEMDTSKVERLKVNGPRPRNPPARPTDECYPGTVCDISMDDPYYYQNWATKTYEWMKMTGLISNADHAVFDGITEPLCDKNIMSRSDQWSYNIALPLLGTAIMYRKTKVASWLAEHEGLRRHVLIHFVDAAQTLYEPACQDVACSNDGTIFLAVLARCLARSYEIAPSKEVRRVLLRTAHQVIATCKEDWSCVGLVSADSTGVNFHSDLVLQSAEPASGQVERSRSQGYIQAQVVALEAINAARLVL